MNEEIHTGEEPPIALEKVSLGEFHDEKWLGDRIQDDPTILGLGELEVVKRERVQSKGGRLDFLLRNHENDTLYELELQLGKTDPSHIIRTIEYWDIERRKNQSYDHRAVLVAEEITSRFFNVIYLMNRAIPIIAIKLDAFLVGNRVALHFTRVLDVYEVPDEVGVGEDDSGVRSEESWKRESNPDSWEATESLIQATQTAGGSVKFNKNAIALVTPTSTNFAELHPRKTKSYVYVYFWVGEDRKGAAIENLSTIDATFEEHVRGWIKGRIKASQVDSRGDEFQSILKFLMKTVDEDS